MTIKQTINLYMDESCHTQFDGTNTMALVTVYTTNKNNTVIRSIIKSIKDRHFIGGELKWNKVGKSNINFYKELISVLAHLTKENRLKTRGLLVDYNKEKITGNYQSWYYMMAYYLFRKIIVGDLDSNQKVTKFNLILDKKDNNSHKEIRKTARYLENRIRHNKKISGMAVDSREFDLIQVADLIAGAMTYKIRGLNTSPYKLDLIKHIEKEFEVNLTTTSSLYKTDFNVFVWDGGSK